MSTADVAEPAAEVRPVERASFSNVIPAAIFALAALVFVLFYCYEYTVWWNGHLSHVLFGLWGLYWGVTLAWGALRIRPRENRRGICHALLWAAFAQGFFFVLFWGVGLLSAEDIESASGAAKAIAYSAAAAYFAGPLLALGFAFTSRRWLVLVLAEVLGPASLWALWKLGM